MLNFLRKRISNSWLSFAEYMEIVLYTPKLGYYENCSKKFGRLAKDGSDFTTAAELSPLFAKVLACVFSKVMMNCNLSQILEIGAGSGQLAIDLLLAMKEQNLVPNIYAIFERSEALRIEQQKNLQLNLGMHHDLLTRIIWLNEIPKNFAGIIFANEVLDAVPIRLFRRKDKIWYERGVSWDGTNQNLIWQDKLLANPAKILLDIDGKYDYITETHEQAQNLVRDLGQSLKKGLLLFVDYGFLENEYYHPQRNLGTLMTHYRHQLSCDPLAKPGLADLSAHINFSAIENAALTCGLELLGYTNQARFLLNSGILSFMPKFDNIPDSKYLIASQALQQLVSEAEMGELFKFMAFTKQLSIKLDGFL